MRLALIDHYDSFTFNVIDWLERDPAVTVDRVAFDDEAALRRLESAAVPVVLSPGPKRPEDQPQTLALLRKILGRTPILGICLGHQQLALLAGARIVAGAEPFHGATRAVHPSASQGLFADMPPFRAATYNSLVVEPGTLPSPWIVTACCERGEIQAIERVVPGDAPAFGIQFHPESFLSEFASVLRRNWLAAAGLP